MNLANPFAVWACSADGGNPENFAPDTGYLARKGYKVDPKTSYNWVLL